jgi:hypothetical protein
MAGDDLDPARNHAWRACGGPIAPSTEGLPCSGPLSGRFRAPEAGVIAAGTGRISQLPKRRSGSNPSGGRGPRRALPDRIVRLPRLPGQLAGGAGAELPSAERLASTSFSRPPSCSTRRSTGGLRRRHAQHVDAEPHGDQPRLHDVAFDDKAQQRCHCRAAQRARLPVSAAEPGRHEQIAIGFEKLSGTAFVLSLG